MEKKVIVVNDIRYEFFFDENLNMWRIIENPNLINNLEIDLEIDLENLNGIIDWSHVIKFIEFILNNKSKLIERIEDAKNVLLALFKSINKDIYDDDFFNQIEFNLSGIDYKASCKIVNMEDRFEYDYFFFPQNTKDPYRDIGSFVWRANFRDTLLLGVYCDRI
jgi:hypothetical protein